MVEKEVGNSRNSLACPVCYDSLTWNGGPGLSVLVNLIIGYFLPLCV